MPDKLAAALADWRIRTVIPNVRGRLLDIGCGTNRLVRQYGNGVGVDVFDWGDVDRIVDDSAELPFEDAAFDTITIIAALNHIPNRVDVLKEAHRLLRDDGRLITTMIPPGISRVWHLLRKPWDEDQTERGMKPGEVFGISAAEMRRILVNSGFKPVVERPFMCWINRLTISTKDVARHQGLPTFANERSS